jgi:hypothetical protein
MIGLHRLCFIGIWGLSLLGVFCAFASGSEKNAAALETPPWMDGESIVFTLGSKEDRNVEGYTALSIKSVERDAKQYWRIRFQVLSEPSSLSIVDVDKQEFLPVYSLYQDNKLGEVEAEYQDEGVRVERRLNKFRSSFLRNNSQTYDVLQSVYLMRMFPIEEGFQKRVYVVNAMHPTKQIPAIMRITKLEQIKTTTGDQLCYRVEVRVEQELYSFWIGADSRRLVYRMETRSGALLELSSVQNVTAEEESFYHSELHGFSLTVVDDWFAFRKPGVPGMETREQVLFMLPDPDCDFSLIRHPLFGEVEAVVEGSINWLKKNRKGFEMSSSDMREFDQGGFKGKRFQGTYQDGDTTRRLYHAIIGDESGLYLFTGDGPDQQMIPMIAGMDAIVSSLKRVPPNHESNR